MIKTYIQKIDRHTILQVAQTLLNLARKNVLATLGVLGLLFAVWFSFSKGKLPTVNANQITMPASSPFVHNISGIGFVEANSKNINIGSFEPGIVQKVLVKEGDHVEAKSPLFELDTRTAVMQVAIDDQEVKALEQSVEAAKATLGYAEDLYNRDKQLKEGVKSRSDIKKVEFDYKKALADLNGQKIKFEQARNKYTLSLIALDKLIIKAPVAGMILKTNLVEGEYISNTSQTPIIIMGSLKPLFVRVQIDENDVWRFEKGSKAVGFLRSNSRVSYPLTLVRFEPYALPKSQLSGDSRELVDTRIVELVYKIEANENSGDRAESPAKDASKDADKDVSKDTNKDVGASDTMDAILIGQQMDVFIETSKAG
jgi:multidrug efflux pump subunit AcrA (membrane-fusion protein)